MLSFLVILFCYCCYKVTVDVLAASLDCFNSCCLSLVILASVIGVVNPTAVVGVLVLSLLVIISCYCCYKVTVEVLASTYCDNPCLSLLTATSG